MPAFGDIVRHNPAFKVKINIETDSPPQTEQTQALAHETLLLVLRRALALAAFAAVAALLLNAGRALFPFGVGLVLVYLLSPIVNRLDRRLPRWVAILLVYVVFGLVLFGAWRLVVPSLIGQIHRLIDSAPAIILAIRRGLESTLAFYDERVATNLPGAITNAIQSGFEHAQAQATEYAKTGAQLAFEEALRIAEIARSLAELLIVPIWLFFVLNSQRKARVSLNRLLSHKWRADFWNVWGIIDRLFSSYLRGQILLCGIIAVIVAIGLSIVSIIPGMRIDYIILLALWAGIAKFIPQFGSLLGGTPGVVLALVMGGLPTALAVLAVYFVADWCENSILVPRIIGESVGVHPAVLTVALVTLGSAFGFAGLLFAAPLTAILRDLYLYTHRRLSHESPDEAATSLVAAHNG